MRARKPPPKPVQLSLPFPRRDAPAIAAAYAKLVAWAQSPPAPTVAAEDIR
jgi:hypothetical protein